MEKDNKRKKHIIIRKTKRKNPEEFQTAEMLREGGIYLERVLIEYANMGENGKPYAEEAFRDMKNRGISDECINHYKKIYEAAIPEDENNWSVDLSKAEQITDEKGLRRSTQRIVIHKHSK